MFPRATIWRSWCSGADRSAVDYPRPRKRLGQHFLTDRGILGRIADALALTGHETVVEIGPGRGALTEQLATRASRVVAVELDGALASILRTQYALDPRVTIVERDILDVAPAEIAGTDDYVLAGNVPYYITTPILFHVLHPPAPARAVFLVQREVAERVVSPPGSKVYGALSVNVQAVATAEILFGVPPRAFTPPPTVDSAVLLVTPRKEPLVTGAGFSEWIVALFGLRRKQMGRILRTVWRLPPERVEELLREAGIPSDRRPETLSPEALAGLYRLWAKA
jgi:16S rRNA (adenine1518-N6/adenine1519-N6)-dimethyltransferase